MGRCKDGNFEKWIISDSRGSYTANEARNMDPNLLTIKDPELAKSLRELLAKYPKCVIDLAKVMQIEGDILVLEERLNVIRVCIRYNDGIMTNIETQSSLTHSVAEGRLHGFRLSGLSKT